MEASWLIGLAAFVAGGLTATALSTVVRQYRRSAMRRYEAMRRLGKGEPSAAFEERRGIVKALWRGKVYYAEAGDSAILMNWHQETGEALPA